MNHANPAAPPPGPKKPRAPHVFAVDQIARFIVSHCANADELARMMETAKKFSLALASAMQSATRQ